MSDQTLSLFLALGATLSFSSASLIYAQYSKRVSVLWMNCFKASVAATALILTIPIFSNWVMPAPFSAAALSLSGLIGLSLGDIFLLSAFTRLGVGRTLILFGFQPLFMGIAAYFMLGQTFASSKLLAILFLIACLFTFSLERYRQERRWEWTGLSFALLGVLMDTGGILLSREAFDATPGLGAMEGHLIRCLGALAGFAVISIFRPFHLLAGFRQWPARSRTILIAASLSGTYLSLILYLSAVKIGHLGSIAGIAITGPMFATLLEAIGERKFPSRYVLVAFAFFAAGFYILVGSS